MNIYDLIDFILEWNLARLKLTLLELFKAQINFLVITNQIKSSNIILNKMLNR